MCFLVSGEEEILNFARIQVFVSFVFVMRFDFV